MCTLYTQILVHASACDTCACQSPSKINHNLHICKSFIRGDIKLAQLVRALDCQSRGCRFDSGKNSKNENSNLHGFEVHRCSNKGTKLLFQVIKAIINQCTRMWYMHKGELCKDHVHLIPANTGNVDAKIACMYTQPHTHAMRRQ